MASPGNQTSGVLQVPYPLILREMKRGFVVPFLGAGASQLVPSSGNHHLLPSGRALAEDLANDVKLDQSFSGESKDLAKVSSYYVERSRRESLRRKLRDVFTGAQYDPNSLHRLLARLANNMLIVTTNYDTLLEQAFQELKKPYDLVVYPADVKDFANAMLWWPHNEPEPRKLKPNALVPDDIANRNVIYKMHGSVWPGHEKWDSFVITEEDYVKFLSRMNTAVPGAFRAIFAARAFLFLGYGLQDWNLRVLLRAIQNSGTSWAILKDPSAFEKVLWASRGVEIHDLRLEDFVSVMENEIQKSNG